MRKGFIAKNLILSSQLWHFKSIVETVVAK